MTSSANSLPIPNDDALAHSRQLSALIHREIDVADGWIDFARYMHLALYAPSLGYYSGGAKKFGSDGDFVTAPEISALFAQTLARQAVQVLQLTTGNIMELGAGTGRLAAALLLELHKLEQAPRHYLILEVSADLRQIQQETLQQALPPELMQRIHWLSALPDTFTGLVIGNEVLDALPVHIIKTHDGNLSELGVAGADEQFSWSERPLTSDHLLEQAAKLQLPPDYLTELCPASTGLVASLATMLQHGVLLFIDYGFPRREYYHPQRNQGTLMCHYRHYAHDDPFIYPGLQDVTAHVDFTHIAETGVANGLQLLGYAGQAQFLINCGITDLLNQVSPSDTANYLPLAAQAQKLLSPAEMGELFKVMALGKGITQSLFGFQRGDKSHTL
jgi:SAM-dependent MidA family methyltransferase